MQRAGWLVHGGAPNAAAWHGFHEQSRGRACGLRPCAPSAPARSPPGTSGSASAPPGPRCGCAAGPGGSSSAGSGASTAPLGRVGLPRGSPQPGAPTRGRPGLGGAGQGLPGPELWQRSPLCSVFFSGHPKPASGNPDIGQLEEETQIKSCFTLHLGASLPKCSHQGTEHTISRYSRIYAYLQNQVCCAL